MSLALATTAKTRMVDQWGGIVPAELEQVPVGDIFKFHSVQGACDIAFAATFVRTFRVANDVPCRAGDKLAKDVDAWLCPSPSLFGLGGNHVVCGGRKADGRLGSHPLS